MSRFISQSTILWWYWKVGSGRSSDPPGNPSYVLLPAGLKTYTDKSPSAHWASAMAKLISGDLFNLQVYETESSFIPHCGSKVRWSKVKNCRGAALSHSGEPPRLSVALCCTFPMGAPFLLPARSHTCLLIVLHLDLFKPPTLYT